MKEPLKNPKVMPKITKPAGSIQKNAEVTSDSEPEKPSRETLAVMNEIIDLLANDDIELAVSKFKSDSEEKDIAFEFANAHIQFLGELVENDYKRGVARKDVEIRDIVSHVNTMLKKKNEYLFSTMIMHSPSHYRSIQGRFYAKIKKAEGQKD